mmetsp:Transcript_22416/g.46058  ORF Transcript_22416/g.46058 Transcript_22416/m.46058 type:complete len:207 (+) Transcript_22416:52-672(+)
MSLISFLGASSRTRVHRHIGSSVSRGLSGGFSYQPRPLAAIVKLDLLSSETPERVKEIWEGYHADKEFNIAETWTAAEFETFKASRVSAGGLFIFPVPRDDGHFIVLTQVEEKHILFTYLKDYKEDPQGAQPYLVVTFYDELASGDVTGPVLVRGEITPLTLDVQESSRLLGLVKEAYMEGSEDVASFNKGTFDFEKHVNRMLKEE